MNIFEKATRERFRFNFKGQISVEDLWVLSLKDLDSIYKGLNAELKVTEEDSLLEIKTKENTVLTTKIEIVKYIVEVKITEEQVRKEARNKKEQKQKILELIASKENEALQGKSIEELQQLLSSME